MTDPRPAVLVVEDEPIILRLVTRILSDAGHRVVAASNAREALRGLAEAGPLIAAVVDATVAPDGAVAAVQALEAAGAAPGLVFASGGLLDPEASRYLEARGGRYVAKPFSPAVLLEAVAAVCRR